ncbi:ABC transporter ATP-binding protein [Haloprofundus marisrubri]|uniref:ABC transporter ATP-binding protein n=1 Tax=Haloprofundus marisrubri TaxID=1514971 RepID=UPI001F0AE465|nr:ABC transporter ATP-binding protein [Haloprofundus marisrubri]
MSEIHLDGVRKQYAGTTALEEVSLHVRDGEFFTLVGPSGCGKTTTLRLIAGFESPTAGEIRFGDEDVSGVPPEDRNVGVVFQNYALFPHMSVAENVGYGLRFADEERRRGRDERIAELLELVDLPGTGDRDPTELSGGQQQRVALARALAPGPRLLLLDEPMSALDARLRERLRLQVKKIQSELGITTVYVTHDQEEALAVSDRVAVMNDGRVEQVGPPREVYERPKTRFVASFVGDNNLFEGELVDVRDRPEVARETKGLRRLHVRVGETVFEVEASSQGSGSTGEIAGVEASQSPRSDGGSVAFCVRPEQLKIDGGENRFTATVRETEFLGETTRVHLDWEGREVTVRAAEPPEAGTAVELGFDPGDGHVFEDQL